MECIIIITRVKNSNWKKLALLSVFGLMGNDINASPGFLEDYWNPIFRNPWTHGIINCVGHIQIWGKESRKGAFLGTFGMSNGIAWYPTCLIFHKNFKIAIGDAESNVIPLIWNILGYIGNDLPSFLIKIFFFDVLGNMHLLSFKIFSFIKIRLFSVGGVLICIMNLVCKNSENNAPNWTDWKILDIYCENIDGDFKNFYQVNGFWLFLSPKIQFDFGKVFGDFLGNFWGEVWEN